MNIATQNFINVLNAKEYRYDVTERDDDVVVTLGFDLDNTKVRINVFVDDDNKHVALRCFGFVKATQDTFAKALLACNKCNTDYRWVKFVIDDDMDVNVNDDAIISADTAGEELFELVIRMTSIVDDCYPIFMKEIWA